MTTRRVLWAASVASWVLLAVFGPGSTAVPALEGTAAVAAVLCPAALIAMWAVRRVRHGPAGPGGHAGDVMVMKRPRVTVRALLWAGLVAGAILIGGTKNVPQLSGVAIVLFFGCPATLITMWHKRRRPAADEPAADAPPAVSDAASADRMETIASALAAAYQLSGRPVPDGLVKPSPADEGPAAERRPRQWAGHLRPVPDQGAGE